MKISSETLLKIEILTRGVNFSDAALIKAETDNAKKQNKVYNLPKGASLSRPQELLIEGLDNYKTVVSCIANVKERTPVLIDVDFEGSIIAFIDNVRIEEVTIYYIKEPQYYTKKLTNGVNVKEYISACGYDELNILPWKGCYISKNCKFCGVNSISKKDDKNMLTAYNISKNLNFWNEKKDDYLQNLKESISIALTSECYKEHAHVILISGNLDNNALDLQAEIYSEISRHIYSNFNNQDTEGIVAVLTPPKNSGKLKEMKESGIDIVVFNLEVGNEPWFSKYCPGKSELGYDFIYNSLLESVKIFGKGKVWSNFVLGLEPIENLLIVCEELAKNGITPGANILHIDEGNQLDCSAPTKEEVIYFYIKLNEIIHKYNLKPYYCSKALRTSIANELFDGRIEHNEV